MKHLLTPLALVLSAAAGWLVYQYATGQREQAAKPPSARPQAVELATITRRDLQERVELVGSLEPLADVTIRSRARGYITALPFDVGDRIAADEHGRLPTVVELEDSTDRELLRGAEAALRVAQAQLAARQARLSFARNTTQRQAELATTGATSAQELDQAQSELAVAQAEVQLEEARVAQAASEVERNRLAVQQARLQAPFEGYVAQRLVEVGALANPDDPLLRIVDLARVRTTVSVVEQDYERLRVGQDAEVSVDAFPDEVFRGTVARIAPVLDPDTRTAVVHVEVDNPRLRLKPGMHARVSIVSQVRPRSPAVPASALLEHAEQPSVFVVAGDPPRVELRPVQIGLTDGDYVEVLSGLDAEACVVTLGSNLLQDGQAVTPLQASATELVAEDATEAPADSRSGAEPDQADTIPHIGG
ncbi:MAG: efflux RND transporter periplasmic adaptor subunit [Pirellulaceae bacterium]|nr:efflux RND transporter periplasmic adaptor subunit [Pirellulaceae bacterium]